MGLVPSTSAAFDRAVEHDHRQRVQDDRRARRRHDGRHFLHVVLPDYCHFVCDGGHECYVAQFEVALGECFNRHHLYSVTVYVVGVWLLMVHVH